MNLHEIVLLLWQHFIAGFPRKMLIDMQVRDCTAYTGPFRSSSLTTVKTTDNGTRGVQKYIGGDLVHLFCIYFSAGRIGFVGS